MVTNLQIKKLSSKEYHSKKEFLSSHDIKDYLNCEGNSLKWSVQRSLEKEPSSAMEFGTLFHTLVLSPENFNKEYMVTDKDDLRSCKAEIKLCEEKGLALVKNKNYVQAVAMRDAAMSNKLAKDLILNSKHEDCYFFNLKDRLSVFKAMPDMVGENFVADLKTSDCGGVKAFSYDIESYGYDIQAAFYLLATGKNKFFFIVCEKSKPYSCVVYELDQMWIELGMEKIRKALKTLDKEFSSQSFSGYENQKLSFPQQLFYKLEELKHE